MTDLTIDYSKSLICFETNNDNIIACMQDWFMISPTNYKEHEWKRCIYERQSASKAVTGCYCHRHIR